MIYTEFKDKKLSQLGFGIMRLPLNDDGTIDEIQTKEMTDYAIAHGVNFFDTAYPYHSGDSERIIGKILSEYPRDSFYLADKYPGHQITKKHDPNYDPKMIFEKQLKVCGVDYFDFYLMHNVYENSIDLYMDPELGIVDYFREQKRLGKIKHLGFSTHGNIETIQKFLDYCGDDMEFCQIQLNYMDWTLQNGKEKYEFLKNLNMPIWIMEPVRGGKLANLNEDAQNALKAHRPDDSAASWCFRFLQELDVKVILSGMSDTAQMQDNIKTFEERKPLNEAEYTALMAVAESLKDSIPCTSCRYCCDGCPKGLDIPMLLHTYSDIRFMPAINSYMHLDALTEDKLPAACIDCGKCTKICPQGIDIPLMLKEFAEKLTTLPKWADVCRQRDKEQK